MDGGTLRNERKHTAGIDRFTADLVETPSIKPTETPAAKTPVPVTGILAGFGAAAVFAVRMRRK